MKQWMFAMLSLVCMFAAAGGSAPRSAAAAPAAPEIGACRWFCDDPPQGFTSAAACDAACSTACEKIC